MGIAIIPVIPIIAIPTIVVIVIGNRIGRRSRIRGRSRVTVGAIPTI